MLKTIIKFAAIAGIAVLAYQAASYYALFKFGDHMSACYPASGVCSVVKRNVTEAELQGPMSTAMSCIKEKQSFIEARFQPIPDVAFKNEAVSATPVDADTLQGLREMCNDFAQQAAK